MTNTSKPSRIFAALDTQPLDMRAVLDHVIVDEIAANEARALVPPVRGSEAHATFYAHH